MSIKASSTYGERANTLLQRSWRMLIDGKLVQAEGGAAFDTTSSAGSRFLAKVPFAQRVDVYCAVEAARAAFSSWRQTSVLTREMLLQRMVDILREHAQNLGIMDSIE